MKFFEETSYTNVLTGVLFHTQFLAVGGRSQSTENKVVLISPPLYMWVLTHGAPSPIEVVTVNGWSR
jgi:hypothetical protein